MSVEDLLRVNQFRTFARGFDHLQPGDELDVPQVHWDNAQAASASGHNSEDMQAQKVAGYASLAGGSSPAVQKVMRRLQWPAISPPMLPAVKSSNG